MNNPIAASVHQRLLNIAQREDRRFNDLLQHYALERWLFRLSRSSYSERFILKGALVLIAWQSPVTRPTRDIDLLARLGNDQELIRGVIAEISQTPVENDGLVFDVASVATERIAEDADYEGVRARFRGHLGNARIAMQVDIGFSDVVTPAPMRVAFPTILAQPAGSLLVYNRESVIAEKLEAMVKLGELNSRMKDFFDVWLLSSRYEFDAVQLATAIRATFARRRTTMESEPIAFSRDFARESSKAAQWSAFRRRSLLQNTPADLSDIVVCVRAFLHPVVASVVENREFAAHWPAGGPWLQT
jgi:predicted nucleotidyltransferase component of viral defense system